MKRKELTSIKQLRLNSILDEATKCLIENPSASMHEIAESAGIGIATLHRYVESREQLMIHLGFRAIEVVAETMQDIKMDEENYEAYIPELIKELIPLGDKIYFLNHDVTVNSDKEIEKEDQILREPLLNAIGLLQQKGHFREDVDKNWIVNVLYSLLFLTWQQVAEGNIAKNSAADLLVNTFYHGFKKL
ncbi:TetR/AcrR family transcriptional regulator [Paenibacillus sp. JNUCC31]|uniref:TetR/AcrR family transcriptional regulator n=1 Tax=Paenibacillus sp. JNUCC-31 TaxID=2777983 RepID=UPI00178265F7|nr:TetR/AcrR family transcriptional regulator [Paenibacillus sp. JNUCC-31]QOS79436.1 TetR/AcrR family transcriptional regulator [Paenibacillus sp. JNUCC-31]